MSKVVEVPGTGNVEFPDDMSDDQIAQAIQANQPKQEPQGFFDQLRQYKAQRVNEPGLSPGAKTLRSLIWGMVPETPGQAAGAAIMTAAGPMSAPLRAVHRALPAAARIATGVGAGATESAIEGGQPSTGALTGGLVTGAAEAAGPIGGGLLRLGTGAKSRISERLAKNVRRFTETQVPELAPAISAAKSEVSPLLRGGRTAAALEETALGAGGKTALGNMFDRGMLDTSLLSVGGTGVRSQALEKAWAMLPSGNPVARELKMRLRPAGGQFNISQAERVLAELGEAAFKGEAASPIARHMGGLELRKLYEQALDETVASLPRQAADVFARTRDKYKAGLSLLDMLRQTTARQAGPNRVILNEPQLQRYVSENRAELRTKLGPAFDDLVAILNRGGQLGTRSITTPGTGETLSALRQVYGRGQGGAPQLIGSAARTALPNLGYQGTGRSPYAPTTAVQTLLDVLGIRAAGGLNE